ncbi:non-ribosomal peptide synthetase [Streptomyces kronopolitis]|uniref:non-ribosomal peptide synthetase n=1 Tax=Streptomyces kronopolitis TaxID=1612435 RepID=UPI0036989513
MRHPSERRPYTRPLSAEEWLYVGMGGRNTIQHVIEGDGTLDAEALGAAMAVASEACPGTRLRRQGREWVDSGTAPLVHVLPGPFDGRLLDSPALRKPLSPSGPTCEVLFVPGEPATVIFRACHAVTDARGLLPWAVDVFRVLRGEQPLGAPDRLNSDEFLQQLDLPDGLPPIPQGVGKLAWPSPLGQLPRRRGGLLWRRRTVDGSHPAITAKVTSALAAAYGPGGRGQFFVPVDLRRHDATVRSTAWLSQALVLDVGPGDGWEETHHRMLTALSAKEELALRTEPRLLQAPLPVLRLMSAAVDRAAVRKGRFSALGFVTHLGAFNLQDFSTAGFRARTLYTLGGTGPGSPPSIEMMESEGRTEITLAWQDGPGVAERAEALLDRVAEALSPRAHRHWTGNDTARALPTDGSVVRLFREQVRRTPDRVALSGPEGPVTYAELSRRADAVAAELVRRGAGRGSVVALLADRSVAGVAGLWGVLRAGACYLPVDAQHPDVRLAGLLTDAGAAFCLVERPYEQRECLPEGCVPLVLDELMAAADGTSGDGGFTDAEVAPDDLAYIIYTSGSTGRPKGVQIEHRNLQHYVHWATREFGVDAETRLPLLTSPSFDVSGTSVFLPLLAGGEVILLRDEPHHLSLRRLLEHSGANTLNLTPSHLDLIGQLDMHPAGFRTIIVIGEQLRVEVAARAQEMFGADCRIVNEYGPTEATIGCTAYTFRPAEDRGRAVVPIGMPADNTQVFLLDAQRRFVAPGEVGEMYLGGVQLARGYRGRPDLDRERFPVLADGTRVYRTGDLARVLPSGGLEFIGRIDNQVKVRGHRVEPAEVAQCLEGHPAADRVVVVARSRPGRPGKSLFAYVLSRAEVTPKELTAYAAERLPRFMVPAAVVLVTELPYTVSGKVDEKALPDPFAEEHGAGAPVRGGAAAPVDPVEEAVARVWARTLGVERSRLDGQADFHRMGGDSLSLLAMVAGVCREVLESGREEVFMAQLATIISDPTLDRVVALSRAAAAGDRGPGPEGPPAPAVPDAAEPTASEAGGVSTSP